MQFNKKFLKQYYAKQSTCCTFVLSKAKYHVTTHNLAAPSCGCARVATSRRPGGQFAPEALPAAPPD
jgi:hypothetical protein